RSDRDWSSDVCSSDLHSREGLIRYLGSGLIKGIGPHYAKKIVDVFGEKTLAVIDESPSFLKQIKGLGPRRLQRIRDSWQTQKNRSEERRVGKEGKTKC